jgi:hypothetical protein
MLFSLFFFCYISFCYFFSSAFQRNKSNLYSGNYIAHQQRIVKPPLHTVTLALQTVALNFINLQTQLNLDFLNVFDGYSSTSPQLASYNGSFTSAQPPPSVFGTQRFMFIRFTSYPVISMPTRGFVANVTTVTGTLIQLNI